MQQLSELESVANLPGEPRDVSAAGVTRTEQRLAHARERFAVRSVDERPPPARHRRRQRARGARDARRDSLVQNGCAPKRPRSVGHQRRAAVIRQPMRRPLSGSSFRRRKGFSIIPNSRRAGISGDGWRIRRPIFCCRSEAETCFRAARRPPVRWRRRWRADRKSGTVPAVFGSARETDGPALLEHALNDAASARRVGNPRRRFGRARRATPLAIARVLAAKYPQTPLVSYIPSVAWANTLRLADVTKDDALRQKVVSETRPWLSGERAAVWRAHCVDGRRRAP